MNRIELTDRKCDVQKELEWLNNIDTGCRSCEHKKDDVDVCLKHGEIPADFIAQGCDQWEYDDVPFNRVDV